MLNSRPTAPPANRKTTERLSPDTSARPKTNENVAVSDAFISVAVESELANATGVGSLSITSTLPEAAVEDTA